MPVTLELEILAPGLRDECDKPEIQQMVSTVTSYFDSANLMGCTQVNGAMYDSLKIKATTVMEVLPWGQEFEIKQLVKFFVMRPQQGSNIVSSEVFAAFNRSAYDELNERLTSINMMAQLKTEEARLSVVFDNDTRERVAWFTNPGNWYDGRPQATVENAQLDPRSTITVKLGDVNMAVLTSDQSISIAAFMPPAN